MDQLQYWIESYGYLAVVLGTFLEGETIVVLAGFAAHRGYLDIYLVILAALVGSFFGDQFLYYCGRRWGGQVLDRVPSWRPRTAQALKILHKHQVLFILGFRFLYGLRAVSALAIGMSGVRPMRFLLLNFASAALWAVSISYAGFLFGRAIRLLLGRLAHYEYYAFGVIAAGGALIWAVHAWQRRRARRAMTSDVSRRS